MTGERPVFPNEYGVVIDAQVITGYLGLDESIVPELCEGDCPWCNSEDLPIELNVPQKSFSCPSCGRSGEILTIRQSRDGQFIAASVKTLKQPTSENKH